MRAAALSLSLSGFLVLGSCSSQEHEPIEEHAFAGPVQLRLYKELGPNAKVSATLFHGEPVEILEQRRVFVRVRNAKGLQGWTYRRNLLMPAEIERLQTLSDWAARFPSQGKGTVYEPLNVHSEPYRWATSFYQVAVGEQVDVVAHLLARRVSSREELEPRRVSEGVGAEPGKDSSSTAAKSGRADQVAPPEPPPPPPVPQNWASYYPPAPHPEASKRSAQNSPTSRPSALPVDDWSLIRLQSGRAGYVLSSRLALAIPDEVAQYASGDRITSYFPLGEVRDGEVVKKHWLWTTNSKAPVPYEFDSFRVFIYSRQRHRYETAYIERNLRGYYPVELIGKEGEAGAVDPAPGFALVVEKAEGQRVRKTYSFSGNRVRLVNEATAPEVYLAPPWLRHLEPQPEKIRNNKKESQFSNLKNRALRYWNSLFSKS